jgi:hypothetical protein
MQNNVKALLEVYKTTIDALIAMIRPLTKAEICAIKDQETTDEDCRSIQSVLAHVVFSGYIYTQYYEQLMGQTPVRPEKTRWDEPHQNIEALQAMYAYCHDFFLDNPTIDVEKYDADHKILTKWGQLYDVEQLFEHSVVHVMRHTRQIGRFLG